MKNGTIFTEQEEQKQDQEHPFRKTSLSILGLALLYCFYKNPSLLIKLTKYGAALGSIIEATNNYLNTHDDSLTLASNTFSGFISGGLLGAVALGPGLPVLLPWVLNQLIKDYCKPVPDVSTGTSQIQRPKSDDAGITR